MKVRSIDRASGNFGTRRFFRVANGTNNSKDQLTGSLEDLNFLNLPADVRERFIRLQHENKMLKLRQTDETNNEQVLILQASSEQLKDQNNQLTNDLW